MITKIETQNGCLTIEERADGNLKLMFKHSNNKNVRMMVTSKRGTFAPLATELIL